MPVAAPVTRAVFPLMNMSHFLKHLVSSNDKLLEGQIVKVVLMNLLSSYCSTAYNVYSYLSRPLHMTNVRHS